MVLVGIRVPHIWFHSLFHGAYMGEKNYMMWSRMGRTIMQSMYSDNIVNSVNSLFGQEEKVTIFFFWDNESPHAPSPFFLTLKIYIICCNSKEMETTLVILLLPLAFLILFFLKFLKKNKIHSSNFLPLKFLFHFFRFLLTI